MTGGSTPLRWDRAPARAAACSTAPRAGRVGSRPVRCPQCSSLDDKVVDSRATEDGGAIRRRRECLNCGHRYTTYERLEEVPFLVVKRSGQREPFDRTKVVAGIAAAAKNRPVAAVEMERRAAEIEEELRLVGQEVTSEQVGRAVLDRLRGVDEVTYLRFASVYKGFSGALDFEREAGLLTKATEPKLRRSGGPVPVDPIR